MVYMKCCCMRTFTLEISSFLWVSNYCQKYSNLNGEILAASRCEFFHSLPSLKLPVFFTFYNLLFIIMNKYTCVHTQVAIHCNYFPFIHSRASRYCVYVCVSVCSNKSKNKLILYFIFFLSVRFISFFISFVF